MGDGEMADLEKNVGLLSSYIRVPPDEERLYKKKQSSEKYLKNGLILVGTSLLVFWLTWLTIRTGAADRDSLGDILATEELLELKQLQSQLHYQLMNKTGADHLDSLDAAVITSELQKLKQEIKNHEGGQCSGAECCAAKTLFKVERFEMVIFEAPEKVVQVVTYDNAAGLKFVDVPKHRDLMKTRHVTDMKDDRLSLQVMEEVKTCMVGKPRQHLPPKMERQLLCGFTEEFNTQHMFASPSATHQNLMFLPMAVVTHDQLPTKLRPHCPSDYKV